MTPLLKAKGLSLKGRLDSTDLVIGEPQLVCLVGPNGSGKTSLLHALAGVGSPSGEVRIDGWSIAGLTGDSRMRLFSYLPASRDLVWPISGEDLIRLGLPAGEEPGDVIESLELRTLISRRLDRLSTGERSRVLIARALAARPKLLLLDEPVSNLDPLWQIRLLDHLSTLPRRGDAGAIVALHDLDLAARYADRLIVMAGGRIAADGPPGEIFSSGVIAEIFGIEKEGGVWRAVSRSADPRSSP
jgi:iron complex transport system ATP-binding protein